MPINRLIAENFRNLQSVDMRPGRRVTFISGENGSGKTSVLEVIYTLTTGRSFRTRKFKNLIAYQCPSFQLFSELLTDGLSRRLGVSRCLDGSSTFKLDGELVSSAVELAAHLPCQVVNSHSFALLEGGPSERRAFIDWLVFHVKPNFRRAWSEYARSLKHRNVLLRSDKMPRSEFVVWNQTLARLGEEIDKYRQEMIDALMPVAQEYLQQWDFIADGTFEMGYQAGWDRSRSLADQLEEHHQRDVALGYTSIGPHKSDIRFTFNKRPVVELFSRGQQKSLVVALYFAQLRVFGSQDRESSRSCLLLLDDLPAELDSDNIHRLCRWIEQLADVQTFITGIELEPLSKHWPCDTSNGELYKMFHVKQGQVKEQPCHWSKS